MPSDKSTVATKADFVPKVVGKTDRDRSFSSVLAHDERSQQPRPEVHPEALNVLGYGPSADRAPDRAATPTVTAGRSTRPIVIYLERACTR